MAPSHICATLVAMPLLVLDAGCSSSSPTGQPTGLGFTAEGLCALVTPAEVSAALGTPVGAGVPSGVNAPSCGWASADSRMGATIAATEPTSVGQIPFGLQGVAGAHATAVSNVGDAAFFASGATGPDAELDIAKGQRAITITTGNTDDPSYSQATQEAAELAIGTAAAKNM
jgi:hypothetical protein